ncbi:MAG TPA: histidine kinase dimerization/phosphoacceptor domain -containing protein [Verrucomicrobiae bacterium]|jgi:PAS domain S-box-containing protein
MNWLDRLCGPTGFMPHGHCYLWNSALLALHLVSDALIALAYFSIPFTLVYFVRKRADLPFSWMFLCFGTFIVACGTTHLMEIWTVWHANYWLSGWVKAFTAAVSVGTAILLVRLIPDALALPSPSRLRNVNEELEREMLERKRVEEEICQLNIDLERRVRERAAQSEAAVEQLKAEIAERARAEAALRQSEARLAGIVNSAMDGIITVDEQQRVVLLNAAAEQMFRCRAADLVGEPLDRLIPARFRQSHQAHVQRFGDTGVTTRRMGALQAVSGLRADGEEFPIEASISQVEADGHRFFTVILRDITERQRAEEQLRASLHEKEVLLKEVHHRVKNNLQIVSSMLNLQTARVGDPAVKAILKENQNRVRSMALVHEQLYRAASLAEIDPNDYFPQLARQVISSFGEVAVSINLHTAIERVPLNPDEAIACGLIINELISNALKYAFPDRHGGDLSITLNHLDGRVKLRVADNGVGLPAGLDPQRADTLGLQIVAALTDQLRGSVQFASDGGAVVTVEFPHAPETARPKQT